MNAAGSNERRVLIVSPAFPPLSTPDLQRVRMSLTHYADCGWKPVVLTVVPRYHEGVCEEALLSTIPADVPVHRCSALPLGLSKWIGLRNLGLRAWWPLLLAGSRLIRREKIDLVFFSNTQFMTFTLGRLWRFIHRTPYVIDLQDPWRTDAYERPGAPKPPGGWKYRLARANAWALEGWSYRRAAGFISVSEDYLRDLSVRYRWFNRVPSEVIRFGASEADLRAAQALPAPSQPPAPGVVRLVYTGAAGPIMPHAVRVLFQALKRFRDRQPAAASRLRLEFVGTSYAPAGRAVQTILPEAAAFGVDDLVTEIPVRLGHLEALQWQARADALLLLGSRDPAYSPSKLYPYFLTGRPMLGVVFAESVLAALMRTLGGSVLAEFQENGPTEAADTAIMGFFEWALAGFPPGSVPPRNEKYFREEFLSEALTRKQCLLFDRALQGQTK